MKCAPLTTATPLLQFRRRSPPQRRRRRLSIAAANSDQQLDLSVLRFTLGIPGLDESYLPRWIGGVCGSLIVLNHFLSPSAAAVTDAQMRSEALGLCLAGFSAALPYIGKFLKGADPVDRSSVPEGNKQVFAMSENISLTQKEDFAWGSYVLLRNTNTMSVGLSYGNNILVLSTMDSVLCKGKWGLERVLRDFLREPDVILDVGFKIIAVQDTLCVRGYWNIPEDVSKAQVLNWFKTQILQVGFLDLKDAIYFPQSVDSQLERILPLGTLSLLVHPICLAFDPSANDTTKIEGFVLLASGANYAYSDKDRAWIRAIVRKYQDVRI